MGHGQFESTWFPIQFRESIFPPITVLKYRLSVQPKFPLIKLRVPSGTFPYVTFWLVSMIYPTYANIKILTVLKPSSQLILYQ
jgi:hypothetical protein